MSGETQGLFDRLLLRSLPRVPRRILWAVARRYVAGEELDDALRTIARLHAAGFGTILDVLGEGSTDAGDAEAAAAEYERALAGLEGVDPGCSVSVKPTHLGLLVDPALTERLLASLCTAAAARRRAVRLEMEDSPTVDATLEVFRRVRRRHANLGCVLQSRLQRSPSDARRLAEEIPGLDVRLVKGIYLEHASIAWTDGKEISRAYVELAEILASRGAFLGLATHDLPLAQRCLEVLARNGGGPPAGRYEFQLLMGVRGDVAEHLAGGGHPVRIYVPYGPEWHAYSLRRLQRNPEIARAVLRAFFGLR